MKRMKLKIGMLFIAILCSAYLFAQDSEPTAREIVEKSYYKMRGKTSISEMTVKIVRPKWERTISMKGWSNGKDFSLIYITAPAKEKGQVFLKRHKEMWNWVPSIERMIKIPPSMMMQSWMGSDMTNDDIVKESSIIDDYDHTVLASDTIDGYSCWKIELIPHEDAPVIWGRIITWISKQYYFPLKNEYYDEDEYLINKETLSKIKDVGDRTIPTYYEIIPVQKKGQKTIMEFTAVKFNVPIKESFFSIQNMKRVR